MWRDPEEIHRVAQFIREVNSDFKAFANTMAHTDKAAYSSFVINVDIFKDMTPGQWACTAPYMRAYDVVKMHMAYAGYKF